MGIFGRNISRVYAARDTAQLLAAPSAPALTISSPWSPQDTLVTLAIDDALAGFTGPTDTLTREAALKIPGIKRAHGITCGLVASAPLRQMDDTTETPEQPRWITTSASGVSPYHRLYGAASDLFFYGWACIAYTADHSDALHVPYGLWKVGDDGTIILDDRIPAEYHAQPVAIPLGYGDNGVLVDGADTIRQARKIEAAYRDRLDNPVPLTVHTVRGDIWDGWTPEERKEFRDQWNAGRASAGGSTAMKPDYIQTDMPGQVSVDLFESGRNAIRLDIANHVGLPASAIEGVRQGGSGGGTEMRYTGVQNGSARGELWEFGLPKRILSAIEARLSLDDVTGPGLSIRADLTNMVTLPEPTTNLPASED